MGNVISFPTEQVRDPYIKFKSDDKETDRFNNTIDEIQQVLEKYYPEAEEFEFSDWVLFAESLTSMIMRAKDIEHPLNVVADNLPADLFEEYGYEKDI